MLSTIAAWVMTMSFRTILQYLFCESVSDNTLRCFRNTLTIHTLSNVHWFMISFANSIASECITATNEKFQSFNQRSFYIFVIFMEPFTFALVLQESKILQSFLHFSQTIVGLVAKFKIVSFSLKVVLARTLSRWVLPTYCDHL